MVWLQLLLLGLLWSCRRIRAGPLELTVLHTNDVHARVEQTSRDSGKCTTAATTGCYGGVARRHTLVQRIRATDRNVLLLDAGDQYQGTVWFSYFKGAEVARFMNRLGYQAMVSPLREALEGLGKGWDGQPGWREHAFLRGHSRASF